MTTRRLLLTGGAGYIGSHTLPLVAAAGYEPLVLDNFSNASANVFSRLQKICGHAIPYIEGDIRDTACLDKVFGAEPIHAVIHFAGLKAPGESVEHPLRYHSVNVGGTLTLLDAMQRHGCKRIVFSSTAAVYAAADSPVTEDASLAPSNPYGHSKRMIEQIMHDLCAADPEWQAAILRYFNPIGAHSSGLIGEHPSAIPNNLVPYVARVAAGLYPEVTIFGDDYPTPDGTGIRDYIHVGDLAQGHIAALKALKPGCLTCNLGTGRGYSVKEVIEAFRQVSGKPIPSRIAARREGDIALSCADPSFSAAALDWRTTHDLNAMIRDHWNWQRSNPNGYED
ncbi:UNVERIFIED_CONTAM: hypothetical protein GTU68_064838 [Idotea baltica]|nr:hypothetical protein [Idotea baltica]